MKTKLLALFLIFSASQANAQNLNGKPFIAVQGSAEIELVPDVFPVKVTLSETTLDAAKAQENVEGLANKVVALAADMKVADADLTVGNLSVGTETKYDDKKETDVFVGNTYEREIRVRFHSLSDLKQFIGALPTGRSVQIETLPFTYAKEAEAKTRLLEAAIRDAKQRAEMMAKSVGKRLLELHNVSDRSQGVSYSYMGYNNLDSVVVQGTAMLAPGTVRSANIVLREGTIKLRTDAYLVYLIGD